MHFLKVSSDFLPFNFQIENGLCYFKIKRKDCHPTEDIARLSPQHPLPQPLGAAERAPIYREGSFRPGRPGLTPQLLASPRSWQWARHGLSDPVPSMSFSVLAHGRADDTGQSETEVMVWKKRSPPALDDKTEVQKY